MQNFSPFSVKNYLVLYDFWGLYIFVKIIFFLGGLTDTPAPLKILRGSAPKLTLLLNLSWASQWIMSGGSGTSVKSDRIAKLSLNLN